MSRAFLAILYMGRIMLYAPKSIYLMPRNNTGNKGYCGRSSSSHVREISISSSPRLSQDGTSVIYPRVDNDYGL